MPSQLLLQELADSAICHLGIIPAETETLSSLAWVTCAPFGYLKTTTTTKNQGAVYRWKGDGFGVGRPKRCLLQGQNLSVTDVPP